MNKQELKPYPGLRSFERHESRIFFGREEQVDELLLRLKSHHFLAVLGASGSGKSSLVKAWAIARTGERLYGGSRLTLEHRRNAPERSAFCASGGRLVAG